MILKLEHFAARLDRMKDFTIHQRINHFYYMQKISELVMLQEQVEHSRTRLSQLTTCLEKEYASAFCQWNQDIRWLNRELMNRQ